MEGQMILALVLVIPIILLPAAFVWYLNVSGIFQAAQEARKIAAASKKGVSIITEVEAE